MAGAKREVDRIVRQLRRIEFGCEVTRTKSGHWKVSKVGCQHVIFSGSPSCPHAVRNAKADLKRYLAIIL